MSSTSAIRSWLVRFRLPRHCTTAGTSSGSSLSLSLTHTEEVQGNTNTVTDSLQIPPLIQRGVAGGLELSPWLQRLNHGIAQVQVQSVAVLCSQHPATHHRARPLTTLWRALHLLELSGSLVVLCILQYLWQHDDHGPLCTARSHTEHLYELLAQHLHGGQRRAQGDTSIYGSHND